MSYAGETYRVPFDRGGLFYDANIDTVPPYSMPLCRNINFHEGGRASRGGTSKINGTAVSGAPRIMGLFDFQRSSASSQVFMGDDGKLYKDSTTTIKTGLATTNYPSFAVFEDELYVCEGDTTPQTWDGAAAGTSNITSPNGDWSGSTQPFQVIVHGRGVSRRLHFLMGSTDYYTSLGDGKVATGGTSGTIPIDTQDSLGLTGGVEFGNRLILFSQRQAYIVDDSDTSTATWGYSQAQWTGGAAHWRVLVKTPNDLFIMAEDGEIYSIASVQEYGDYKRASLTRPAKMDRWIRENIDLTKIDRFHGCYDPKLRAVRYFMVRSGQSTVDTCLKFYIDRPAEEAWAVDDGIEAASGFDASCSAAIRASTGTYEVWTGDHVGFLWKLERTNKNDADSAYTATFKTPNMALEDPRGMKCFRRGILTLRPEGTYDLSIKVFVDGTYKDTKTVSLAGGGAVYGTGVYDTDVYGGNDLIEADFDLGYIGRRIQFEIFNSTVNQDFFVSALLIDEKPLGKRPTADTGAG